MAITFASAVRDSREAADLVTRKDLEIALAPIRGEQKLQRWMLGAVLGGIIALVSLFQSRYEPGEVTAT